MEMGAKFRWAARAEKLEGWARSADAKADAIDAAMPPHARDPAFMTQPGNIPQRLRDKLTARERRAWEFRERAKDHRAKAAELRRMAARNKGDAERARQTIRDAVSAAIEPWMYVDSIYGVRKVLKVNAKTLRLEGALGPLTIDKSLCKVVPERCGTCRSWRRPLPPETEGGCWSGDRLDGDFSKGPASYTLPTSACEAWLPPTRQAA